MELYKSYWTEGTQLSHLNLLSAFLALSLIIKGLQHYMQESQIRWKLGLIHKCCFQLPSFGQENLISANPKSSIVIKPVECPKLIIIWEQINSYFLKRTICKTVIWIYSHIFLLNNVGLIIQKCCCSIYFFVIDVRWWDLMSSPENKCLQIFKSINL